MEEHTRAKHELLKIYLEAWFPILATQDHHEQIVFIDGFAGPGIYDGGEPGSPVIALETLIRHRSFPRLADTSFDFIFVETRPDRFERLKSEVTRFWSRQDYRPANVRIRWFNKEFVTVAREIQSDLQGAVPTFAFVDPFGWSQAPMSVIREVFAFDKCEVLITFMSDQINRFLTHPEESLHYSLDALFGTKAYHQAATLEGDDRKVFLRELYVRQLRDMAGFRFSRPFEFRDMRRGTRTMYFLMFGTHHVRGLDRMKTAMWKLDPEQGVLFLGLTSGDPLLFEPEPNLDSLRDSLKNRFIGQTIPVEDIEEFTIVDTDYTSSHYKGVLKDLERDGLLESVTERRRAYTYPEGTILRFLTSAKPRNEQLSLGDF